jgi:Holliday junction resolvase RusA-like endonuclease
MNLIIDYEPTSKGVPRTKFINGHVLTYYNAKTTEALESIRTLVANQGLGQFPPHIPIKLTVTFWRTKSKWLPKHESSPFRKPDLDNFLKLTIDTISSILIPDDAQITTIDARKRWSPNGHGYIEVSLEEDKC